MAARAPSAERSAPRPRRRPPATVPPSSPPHIPIAKPVAIFLPDSRDILLDTPRMLFLRNEYGSYFAGFYPHALVLLMVLLGHRLFAAGKWLAYFAIYLVGLSALPSHRVNGAWVTLVPHIFRYL